MKLVHYALSLALLPLPVLAACDKDEDEGETSTSAAQDSSGTESDTGGSLQWYTSCGDPVCSGYGGPWDGVPACGEIKEGDPCETEGETCDFQSDCNAVLVCAKEDPKLQPGGCPISRARFKQDIAYIDAAQRDAYYRELLELRLATYRYRARRDQKTQLGVILEDNEEGVWVDAENDRVDLYGYGSLAIAGVQAQAAELEALRAELGAMKAELAQLRSACEPVPE
jgi:hypothetical protein